MKKALFIAGLLALLAIYLNLASDITINSLSSDVWGYQYLELHERLGFWPTLPPSYNQSEWYIVFPLFYYLNPGLEGSLIPYHLLTLSVIFFSYLLTGFVVFKLFKSWTLATVAGLLAVIPRYAFPTKVGILSIGTLRGNALFFPFYFLISYYWIAEGLRDKRKNIAIGIVAGLTMYIYPPSALMWTGVSAFAAFMVHGKEHLKPIAIFLSTFVVVTLPFWGNHFLNPNTAQIKNETLTSEQVVIKNKAFQEAFAGNGFLGSVEFEEMKRIVWDQAPFLLFFLLSLYLVKRYKDEIGETALNVTKASIWMVTALWGLVLGVEFINWMMMRADNPPVFIEHFRQLRGVGYVFFMQFIVLLYLLFLRKKNWLAYIMITFVMVTPIIFFAPVLRTTVRAIVPEDIRLKYNLAPIVPPSETKDFNNLVSTSVWARENLSRENTKFFVFDEYQDEFKFKVMSKYETNLTQKEGTIWVSSEYENAEKWYFERMRYKDVVQDAVSFNEILMFAKELDSTHILLPRGDFGDLYDQSKLNLKVIYSNPDYRILEI